MRLLIVLAILCAARAAKAGWYYTWTCTGDCAAHQLAASGVRGPYDSEAECSSARGNDPVNQLIMQSGNLGTVSWCSDSDGPPEPGSSSHGKPPPTQRWSVGVVAGSGYRVRDPSTMTEQVGAFTTGLDARVVIGGRPGFGLTLAAGGELTRIDTKDGSGTQNVMYAPLLLGLFVAPRVSPRARIELGGEIGGKLALMCKGCDGMTSADGYLGVDLYGSGRTGISIQLVYQATSAGPEALQPPDWFVRAMLVRRNLDLDW